MITEFVTDFRRNHFVNISGMSSTNCVISDVVNLVGCTMPRSVKIHPACKQQVISALERNGFLTQGDLAAHLGIALSTVSNFINSKPVFVSTFEQICEKLNLDKREITKSDPPLPLMNFFVYDSSWVGREKLINELSNKARGSCKVLLLVGITGIGKTALAERIVEELRGDWREHRDNFEDEHKASDFASVAQQWLEKWGEIVPKEERKQEKWLQRLEKGRGETG